MSQHRAEPPPLHDLDATDRLPVLDPTGLEDDDPYATTGTWVAPDEVAIADGDAEGTLSRLVGDRDNEITSLTDALREKSLAADRLERELGQAHDELARLRSESDQQLRTAGARALELDRARLELATQLDASHVALASLEQRAAEAERLAAGLTATSARDREERESLAASLAASQAECRRLEELAIDAKSERDRLANEVAALAERLLAAERTAAQSRDEQSAALLRERDDAEAAKLALQATLAAVQGELAETRSALHQSRTVLERALEGRRTAEARRQYASDFRHALPSRRLRRELAASNEHSQALAARLAMMEAAQAEARAASESSLRELYARLREAEEARDSAERRADELAVRARDAEATLAAVDAGEGDGSRADEPTIAREDPDALARQLEELSGEVARRDDRIVTLEAELRVQSEALETIRRSLGALSAGRSTGDDGEPDATLPRRYLVPLDDDGRSICVLDRRRITVGRTPENGLTVQEPYISRLHAVLRLGPEVTVVEDAASTNGVFVNDHRVHRQVLHDGDIVAFGKMRFRFQLQPVVGDG